jgi:phenylacetate-CoA ligase
MIRGLVDNLRFAQFCTLHRRSLGAQRRWQWKHLKKLVAHAYRNVPIWKPILDEHRIHPGSVNSLEDLRKLPVSRKETYVGKVTDEYTDCSGPTPSYWYVTSGTSGKPFTFLMSDHAREERYRDFASLRFLWWRGESISAISVVDYARVKIQAESSKHRFFLSVEEYLKDPPRALRRIAKFGPRILGTYPSLLSDMAEHMKKNGTLRWPELEFALSFGETLSPSVRSVITDGLKCEVYDRYGLEEIGVLGLECVEHDGLHVPTESVIVEIIGDSFESVSEGVEGRIVATDLFNYGMPFIRYDTGDRGKISFEPCACGLKSPRIWVKGRETAYLTFPTRRIHHLEFDAAMDTFMNYILQYQIAKKSETHILARVIPGPAFYPEIIAKVKENISKLVGDGIQVDTEMVEILPRTDAGKSKIVIDESGK